MRRWRPVGLSAHPRTGGEHWTAARRSRTCLGSPPHGRGTQLDDLPSVEHQRLTPARAGNTPAASVGCRRSWAHPRTGGEHSTAADASGSTSGSPPHGRETQHQCGQRRHDRGLTPARAGNTPLRGLTSGRTGAHPRTGGEHITTAVGVACFVGSPPHGRGTLQGQRPGGDDVGLTPARAGNTSGWTSWAAASRAHPRTGGEHKLARPLAPPWSGSPPHGRGTLAATAAAGPCLRLTPARAGNTARLPCSGPLLPAHPRTGGEHVIAPQLVESAMGSPPHGRGTRRAMCRCRTRAGLTPARAGNTTTLPSTSSAWAAHPRTGGEHRSGHASGRRYHGSPPHGRGTLGQGLRDGLGKGLTPARAGNTPRTASRPGPRGAHPRTGGEHSLSRCTASSMRGSPPHGRGTPGEDTRPWR